MKYFNLVIDCTNLFWRSSYVNIKKRLKDNKHKLYSSLIQDSFNRIIKLRKQFGYKNSVIYCLFDNPLSKINLRKVISNGKYKSNRDSKDKPEGFDKFLKLFMKIMKYYDDNFYICNLDSNEADDLVQPILNYIKLQENKSTLLISADLDWARGIDKYTHWFNYNNIYDISTFQKKYKFPPYNNKIKIYKAIHGDNIDCIENAVPNLPRKTLIEIINTFNNIEDVFKNIQVLNCSDEWKKRILESENKIKVNYVLVDYMDIGVHITKILTKCSENLNMLRMWYDLVEIQYETRMKKKREFWASKTSYRSIR